ncbi:D-alanyl-D-alanine endopeptidase [Uliginosibacterium sp. H1]|uniref:D-alanyl-D-alanine endopeptidase n=1 Tax=Uliginosibacterium sp. H1 TaxID=3114757 RepID=UPI002E18AF4F|nr:D-alanyl-D-alanine endopeptidase [Uliginosibacterium sp. H1]
MVAAVLATIAVLVLSPAPAEAAQRSTTAKKSARVVAVKRQPAKKPARRAAPAPARKVVAKAPEPEFDREGNPLLRSSAFLVQDLNSGEVILEKNSAAVLPIASITKLMTAMVVLDAHLGLDEQLVISEEDLDRLKGTGSRLGVGTTLSREDMLRLALMSSENRAASALGRHYPGGQAAFVEAMNHKAHALGLHDTRFYDSIGLNKGNVSSARDLAQMVSAASHYPLIREFSTMSDYAVSVRGRAQQFRNTNSLVASPDWQIGVSKTGFINESGKCLVMQAWMGNKPVAIVLLDSWGRYTRIGDAQRVRKWVEAILPMRN